MHIRRLQRRVARTMAACSKLRRAESRRALMRNSRNTQHTRHSQARVVGACVPHADAVAARPIRYRDMHFASCWEASPRLAMTMTTIIIARAMKQRYCHSAATCPRALANSPKPNASEIAERAKFRLRFAVCPTYASG